MAALRLASVWPPPNNRERPARWPLPLPLTWLIIILNSLQQDLQTTAAAAAVAVVVVVVVVGGGGGGGGTALGASAVGQEEGQEEEEDGSACMSDCTLNKALARAQRARPGPEVSGPALAIWWKPIPPAAELAA